MNEAALNGGDCLFGLVIGAPDAEADTFLGCDPIQRHLYAVISFRIKPVSSSSSSSSPSPASNWTPFQLKQKGLSSKRARSFADLLSECLPAEERTRRLQKAEEEEQVMRSRRSKLLKDYKGLSSEAKGAFDGEVSLWSGQNLMLGGKLCRRLQGDKVEDADRASVLQSLGYPDMGAPIPVRFVVKTDRSAGSFKTGRYRTVPLGATAEAYSFDGVWLPLPFVISGMHAAYANETSGFDRIDAVFKDIGKVTIGIDKDAQDTTPVFFRPYEYKIDRTGKAGGGSFLLSINPTPYASITIPADTMRRVWGGDWGVEPKQRRDAWVHIKGSGARKFKDLNFCLSRDKDEHWVERCLEHGGKMKGLTEREVKARIWIKIQAARAQDEARTGKPWSDGVWSHQMEVLKEEADPSALRPVSAAFRGAIAQWDVRY